MNTDTAANDLTQLSSREQLSALMDGALPADQTRFLLRRLHHDEALAGCWERWRIAGETMRGLAPARRLPPDFAARVAAALAEPVSAAPRRAGTPAWLRWGGGGMLAASLAVVALMARQPPAAVAPPAPAVAQARLPAPPAVPTAPAVPAGSNAQAGQALAAAASLAVAARPAREERRATARVRPAVLRAPGNATRAIAAVAEPPFAATEPDIATRPWPRSILPQYAAGGLTVGFGEHARQALPRNPFQPEPGVGGLPAPSAVALPDAGNAPAAEGTPPPDAPAPQP